MSFRMGTWIHALSAALLAVLLPSRASAEPTDPVVIGWWSYFDYTKVPTTTNPGHSVTSFGDPDTYYYEPSTGHGMQEDPNILPPDEPFPDSAA